MNHHAGTPRLDGDRGGPPAFEMLVTLAPVQAGSFSRAARPRSWMQRSTRWALVAALAGVWLLLVLFPVFGLLLTWWLGL